MRVAGSASIMTNPLDLAKTRMQLFANTAVVGSSGTQGLPYNYSSLGNCFTDIVRREGWAALMKGAGGCGAYRWICYYCYYYYCCYYYLL
jgi:hypothetical protein